MIFACSTGGNELLLAEAMGAMSAVTSPSSRALFPGDESGAPQERGILAPFPQRVRMHPRTSPFELDVH